MAFAMDFYGFIVDLSWFLTVNRGGEPHFKQDEALTILREPRGDLARLRGVEEAHLLPIQARKTWRNA